MRHFLTVALIGATGLAAPALADGHGHYGGQGHNMTQPASNEMAVYAYPTANYCPAGLQPVMIGGVICCGTPTHTGNPYPHPAPKRAHKPVHVSYSKSPSDVIVYEKGQ